MIAGGVCRLWRVVLLLGSAAVRTEAAVTGIDLLADSLPSEPLQGLAAVSERSSSAVEPLPPAAGAGHSLENHHRGGWARSTSVLAVGAKGHLQVGVGRRADEESFRRKADSQLAQVAAQASASRRRRRRCGLLCRARKRYEKAKKEIQEAIEKAEEEDEGEEEADDDDEGGDKKNNEKKGKKEKKEKKEKKDTSETRRRRSKPSSGGKEGLGSGRTYHGDEKVQSEGYKLVFSDYFDKDGAVDGSKWYSVHKGGGFGNRELQFYTNRKQNAEVKDGILYIRGKKERFGRSGFTSAKLQTKAQWKYGKMVVRSRMKDAKARGTWGAHWMMPRQSHYGGWPNSGEIDIMEYVGYNNEKVYGTVHTGAYNHKKGTQKGGSMNVDIGEWHNYTVEWREDKILFACDLEVYQLFERESATNAAVWPFNQPFYLILNLAIGGEWGGQKGIDNAAFSSGQVMEIDFVEVWQKK